MGMATSIKDINFTLTTPAAASSNTPSAAANDLLTRSKKHQPRQGGGPKGADSLLITGASSAPTAGLDLSSQQPGKVVKNGKDVGGDNSSLLEIDEAERGDEAIYRRESQKLMRASLKRAHHYDSRVNCKTW